MAIITIENPNQGSETVNMLTSYRSAKLNSDRCITIADTPGRWLRTLGSAILLISFSAVVHAADKYQDMINCDLHKGPCSQVLDGHTVTLAVSPRPVKAMTDLSFEVVFENDPAMDTPPFIDLGMPGMNMGKNRVTLKPEGRGVYRGTGVIVRCKSGRHTWRATLTCPGMGSTDFIFNVIH